MTVSPEPEWVAAKQNEEGRFSAMVRGLWLRLLLFAAGLWLSDFAMERGMVAVVILDAAILFALAFVAGGTAHARNDGCGDKPGGVSVGGVGQRRRRAVRQRYVARALVYSVFGVPLHGQPPTKGAKRRLTLKRTMSAFHPLRTRAAPTKRRGWLRLSI